MTKKSQKQYPQLEIEGMDFAQSTYQKRILTVQLPPALAGGISNFGMAVSGTAAHQMIREGYWKPLRDQLKASGYTGPGSKESPEQTRLLDTHVAVTFSKEVLLLLLAQNGCAGIKFYYCLNHEGDTSLVLAGVDQKNNDLGSKGTSIVQGQAPVAGQSPESALLKEVGGPRRLRDFLNENLVKSDFEKFVEGFFSEDGD